MTPEHVSSHLNIISQKYATSTLQLQNLRVKKLSNLHIASEWQTLDSILNLWLSKIWMLQFFAISQLQITFLSIRQGDFGTQECDLLNAYNRKADHRSIYPSNCLDQSFLLQNINMQLEPRK